MCAQSNVVKFISSNALIFRMTSWLDPRSKLDIVDCCRCKENIEPPFLFSEFSLDNVWSVSLSSSHSSLSSLLKSEKSDPSLSSNSRSTTDSETPFSNWISTTDRELDCNFLILTGLNPPCRNHDFLKICDQVARFLGSFTNTISSNFIAFRGITSAL